VEGDIFATTHWSVIVAAGQRATPQSRLALEELCKTYWFPLYTYARRRGHSKEDAEDLTQSFFAKFLEKNYLDGLNAERGRFRAFLLASLKHFLANEWDKAQRQKRGGHATHLSLDGKPPIRNSKSRRMSRVPTRNLIANGRWRC
jgi:RNA polymerase sigma-70 factor (ECF subfamily)